MNEWAPPVGVVITEEERSVLLLDTLTNKQTITTSSDGGRCWLLPLPKNRWAIERIAELRGVELNVD